MEKCPQCNADRIPDENFCDSCGHKYTTESKANVSAPQVDNNGGEQSFDDYEKDYLKRILRMQIKKK